MKEKITFEDRAEKIASVLMRCSSGTLICFVLDYDY